MERRKERGSIRERGGTDREVKHNRTARGGGTGGQGKREEEGRTEERRDARGKRVIMKGDENSAGGGSQGE